MIDAGIIDPVKVVRGALENAASIAAMILTTDVLVTDIPERTSLCLCLRAAAWITKPKYNLIGTTDSVVPIIF